MESINEILAGEFTLDVCSFVKHNPGKTTGWIKLKNDWFSDPAMVRLTPTERYLFVALCSLRATSEKGVGNLCVTSLQRRVNLSGRGLKRCLSSLWKEGLISLQRKKEREEREEEKPKISVLPDLAGIEDEFLETLTSSAQESWVKKYGAEAIREIVPTAYSVWKKEKPCNQSGNPTPATVYVSRWLDNHKKWARNGPHPDSPEFLKQEIDRVLAEVRSGT